MSANASSPPASAVPEESGKRRNKRGGGISGNTGVAFALGVPLAVAIIVVGGLDSFEGTVLQRYLHHPIERVEIVVFCCALGALAAKFVNGRAQRRALAMPLLPPWDGRPQPPAEASALLAEVSRRPSWLQNSWVERRTSTVLDFVCRRRSAADLDDHLRGLSDADAVALEGSYALVRFLVWSLPILGFIGTVLGIAKSIAGVTPDVLEKSISSVTEGLALAFDTTGLGLMLTMVVMLLIYLAERREQAVLEEVDRFTDLHLAHRFERPDGASGPFLAALQESTRAALRTTEQLVQRQAELWAQTLAQTEERRQSAERQQQERLTASLEAALERTQASHAERLADMSRRVEDQAPAVLAPLAALGDSLVRQQATLLPLADGMQLLAATLTQLQENEGQLLRLQQLLQQNLAGLAASGSFEEAVHSLSAAVHLLTARTAGAGWRVAGDEPRHVA
ncbi:MAG: MotA/TolQ/ExbB proton channel family protein [Planctomycetes bacterium]|nr:MotA/TolQ/ExbB proton channel family protein [Planctomycetota bacterium]